MCSHTDARKITPLQNWPAAYSFGAKRSSMIEEAIDGRHEPAACHEFHRASEAPSGSTRPRTEVRLRFTQLWRSSPSHSNAAPCLDFMLDSQVQLRSKLHYAWNFEQARHESTRRAHDPHSDFPRLQQGSVSLRVPTLCRGERSASVQQPGPVPRTPGPGNQCSSLI